jgi:hypothetical protein
MLGGLTWLLLMATAAAYQFAPCLPCHARVEVLRRSTSVVAKDRIDDHIQTRWEQLIGRAATERIATVAGDETMEETARTIRDGKLAERDTRKWCLDRCLATGYCDAVEDLLEMTTEQVRKFCEECASLDECELDIDRADVYMSHIHRAAMEADGSEGHFD